jgi:hypothetical protein
MNTKPSLKSLVGGKAPAPAAEAAPEAPKSYRTAQTRINTRAISGHFPSEVARDLRVLAGEQEKDTTELLGEALNMLFQRYGKPTRVEIVSGRRKRS